VTSPETPRMRYRRDVPIDDRTGIDATVEHIRAHLSATADADDDPTTHAARVEISMVAHPDPTLISIIGELAATPDAPYLRPGYDPAADHPHIAFEPYAEPERDHHPDPDAVRQFREVGS
jgi:hypothetical protein